MLKDFHGSIVCINDGTELQARPKPVNRRLATFINGNTSRQGLPYNPHYTAVSVLCYTTIRPTLYYTTKKNKAALYYLVLNSLKDTP